MERSFVRLEPGMEPGAARDRLARAACEWALVRHRVGATVTWHAVPADEARRALSSPNAPTVATALSLGNRTPATTRTAEALDGVTALDTTTIVLSGDRVLAVLTPDDPVPEVFASPTRPRERADDLTRRSGRAAGSNTVMFSADAHVDAPPRVRLNESFTFTISLTNPAALEGEGRLNVELAADITAFDLDVQLFAQGFDAAPHKTGVLSIDANNVAASSLSFELTAVEIHPDTMRRIESGEATEWETSITVMFLRGGPVVGSMVHPLIVEVAPSAETAPANAPEEEQVAEQTAGTTATIGAPSLPVPDLTINLSGTPPTDGIDGRYEVYLCSPHRAMPGTPFVLNLGMDAEAFAAQRYAQIKEQDGGDLGYEAVAGVGTQIARLLGADFWAEVNATLAHAADLHGETPTVLLQTSDPHVPWELAHLGDTPVDPDAPPFLAAQARVGRWIFDPRNHIDMADTVDFRVDNLATVIGQYDPLKMKKSRNKWKRLPEAEAEGAFLEKEFGAVPLSAQRDTVAQLLARKVDPPPQLLHFACHGTSMPGGTALIANDGTTIPDVVFERSVAGSEDRPFVFLNACRVGAGAEAANQYGGFASSFLRAGSTGFIGPLWEVNDTLAREIAADFYRSVADGVSPAEVLRRNRAKFVDAGEGTADPPSTYMAYVYYGHPAATISGIRPEIEI